MAVFRKLKAPVKIIDNRIVVIHPGICIDRGLHQHADEAQPEHADSF